MLNDGEQIQKQPLTCRTELLQFSTKRLAGFELCAFEQLLHSAKLLIGLQAQVISLCQPRGRIPAVVGQPGQFFKGPHSRRELCARSLQRLNRPEPAVDQAKYSEAEPYSAQTVAHDTQL